MQTWLSLVDHSLPKSITNESIVLNFYDSGPNTIQLSGKSSLRQFTQEDSSSSNAREENTSSYTSFTTTSATTQQAAIADVLNEAGALWKLTINYANPNNRHGALPNDHRVAIHSIAKDSYQPYVEAYCLRDKVYGSNDQRSMAFPVSVYVDYTSEPGILKHINASISGYPATEYPFIRRAELLQLPGAKSNNRVKWVQLPQSTFAGISIGLIVLLPQATLDDVAQDNATTSMVICNVGAGWGSSTINLTTLGSDISATSSKYNIGFRTLYSDDSSPEQNGETLFQANNFGSTYYDPPLYPAKAIEIDEDWAEYLNPWVPAQNTSVIDFLLKGMSDSVIPQEVVTQYIVSGLMANGLARVGFASQFQGSMKMTRDGGNRTIPDSTYWVQGKGDVFAVDPVESKDWVKLRVDSTIEGYSYNTRGASSKISIAFLLTYCVLAVMHCFYSGISGMRHIFHALYLSISSVSKR